MFRKTLPALLSFLIPFCSFSQAKVDSDFHIYLLIGQSNMAGRGEITGKYEAEGSPQVYMLDKNNEWVLAKHPLHFDKPQVAGVGPGLAFALHMAAANPKAKIGLVPCAVGGSSIDVWKPGAYDKNTKTHPYDDTMKRIAVAREGGVFKGALWHQGESDSMPEGAAIYLPKLITLIGQVRDSTHNLNLPFVVGELGTYKPQYTHINKILAQLPAEVPLTAVASSQGLNHKGDVTHFDSPSAALLGERFAREMKRLQKNKKLR